MSNIPSISPKTRERLAHPAQPGQRHADIVKIASALIADGFFPEAVFEQIRPNYGPDLPDTEIRSVIAWASKRFGNGPGSQPKHRRNGRFPFPLRSENARFRYGFSNPFPSRNARLNGSETPEEAVIRFLGGFRCEEADLWERSPVRLPEKWERDAEALLAALYRPDERLNILSAFSVSGGKPHPIGSGKTRPVSEWISQIARNGPPVSPAGAWIRPNPVSGSGISDADVSAFRFLLIESDAVSIPFQIPFVARLPLPISAVIYSGGKSLHAWVKIDAETISGFRSISARIYAALAVFGIDPANKNPSRLSRLPGVSRELGGIGERRQKLLFLNPEPTGRRIFE